MSVQIDEIAKVPGIDVLFIGPFDLGNNIGHPILDGIMQPELKEAIAKIMRAAKENKKSTGIYATSGEQARSFADQGFNMVCWRLRLIWISIREADCTHRYPSLQTWSLCPHI